MRSLMFCLLGSAMLCAGAPEILFDARTDDSARLAMRTKSWIKGGDLTPIGEKITAGDASYIRITYSGSTGESQILLSFDDAFRERMKNKECAGIAVSLRYSSEDLPTVLLRAWTKSKQYVPPQKIALKHGLHEYTLRFENLSNLEHVEIGTVALPGLTFDIAAIGVRTKTDAAASIDPQRTLVPRVKKAVWKEGRCRPGDIRSIWVPASASERTKLTARIFSEKFRRWTGVPLTPVSADSSGTVSLAIADLAVPADGYSIDVAADRVMLRGKDERGLFYAVTTYMQLLAASFDSTSGRTIHACSILDWPDCTNRAVKMFHPGHWAESWEFKTAVTIDDLLDWTERYIVGMKATHFFPDLSSAVRFETIPEMGSAKKFFSMADLKRLKRFCDDNFIELGTSIEIGSHANYSYLNYFPELKDKDFVGQADIEHPKHWAVVTAMIQELADAMKIRYFSPGGDEYWYKTENGIPLPADSLQGKTHAQSFLDLHVKLNSWLKERGITMFMYCDMLDPQKNGTRYDVASVLDRMPRDIIMCPWYDMGGVADYFGKRGFRVWSLNTYWDSYYSSREKLTGFGVCAYGYGARRSFLFGYEADEYTRLDKVIRAMDYSWNMKADQNASVHDEVESGFLGAAFRLLSVRPVPNAGAQYATVPLAGAYSTNLRTYLSGQKFTSALRLPGSAVIGTIPMQLPSEEGSNVLVVGRNALASIAVNAKAASIVFLHSLTAPDMVQGKEQKYGLSNVWPLGLIAGKYVLRYADGTSSERLIVNDKNINNCFSSAYTLDPYECRASQQLGETKDLYFFQYEFVNPYPEKTIVSVEIRHADHYDVQVLLLAMSVLPTAN